MGGLALPALAIRDAFPEVWQANRTPNALDTEMWRLRAAAMDGNRAEAEFWFTLLWPPGT
ncbi:MULTISPECIES: VMAP-related conflict system protein [Streptomyces]|uniref:VMAP-related conflict system protein n=1 Tax=Streptomyces TaxID=1883 RepID=UPI0029309C4E|nr:VMAP-related conflict system protein [Streptomyces sp. NEAU-HV9]